MRRKKLRYNSYHRTHQVQLNTCKFLKKRECSYAAQYVGNIFLLGLTTLAGEVIDTQAANALNVLLQPFQNDQNDSEFQEILASDIQDTDVIDLLDGLL